MTLENITLCEISQSQRGKCMLPFIWGTWNRQIHRDRKQKRGYRVGPMGQYCLMNRVSVWEDKKVRGMGSGDSCTTLNVLRVTGVKGHQRQTHRGTSGCACLLEERQRLGATSVGQRGCPLYQTHVPSPEVISENIRLGSETDWESRWGSQSCCGWLFYLVLSFPVTTAKIRDLLSERRKHNKGDGVFLAIDAQRIQVHETAHVVRSDVTASCFSHSSHMQISYGFFWC